MDATTVIVVIAFNEQVNRQLQVHHHGRSVLMVILKENRNVNAVLLMNGPAVHLASAAMSRATRLARSIEKCRVLLLKRYDKQEKHSAKECFSYLYLSRKADAYFTIMNKNRFTNTRRGVGFCLTFLTGVMPPCLSAHPGIGRQPTGIFPARREGRDCNSRSASRRFR